MNEFINPKSMATPGAAGALVMLITNTICFQFIEVSPRFTSLLISLLLGFTITSMSDLTKISKAMVGTLNSLIIFSVATGTAGIASQAAAKTTNLSVALEFVVPSSHAQTVNSISATDSTVNRSIQIDEMKTRQTIALRDRIADLQFELSEQKALTDEAQRTAAEAKIKAHEEKVRREMLEKKQAAAKLRFFREW